MVPDRHPPLRPRILLVVRILPVAFPARAAHFHHHLQSFQILAILLTTLVYSVVYGYRFWTAIGLLGACFPFVVSCQLALLSCILVCHVGVLLLHYVKGGGCNGIGAWLLNSVLNCALLFLFLNFYVRMHLREGKHPAADDFGGDNDRRLIKLEAVKEREI